MPPTLPEGVAYISEVISPAEEGEIVAQLDRSAWSAAMKRRVQHFGYRYNYKARTVTSANFMGELPRWLGFLATRLVESGCFATLPDQVIANEYWPGQGISAHVDCVPCFGDTVVSISLLSPCEMVFRQRRDGQVVSTIIHPRSAIVLKGAGRYNWTHEIPARKSDRIDGIRVPRDRRISLTFRNVL